MHDGLKHFWTHYACVCHAHIFQFLRQSYGGSPRGYLMGSCRELTWKYLCALTGSVLRIIQVSVHASVCAWISCCLHWRAADRKDSEHAARAPVCQFLVFNGRNKQQSFRKKWPIWIFWNYLRLFCSRQQFDDRVMIFDSADDKHHFKWTQWNKLPHYFPKLWHVTCQNRKNWAQDI